MAAETKIEWCDATWSPVWGCTQVSPACDNCYAMNLARRFGTGWNGAPLREFGEHHWNEPVRWNRKAAAAGTRLRVFPSMCDPFDKAWPAAVRERFWRLVDATPYLTWLLLTKRVGNVNALGPPAMLGRWPANVWIGATVVNQEEVDRDAPKLLELPARVRFLSCEPLLGPLDLSNALQRGRCPIIGPAPGRFRCGLPAGHGPEEDHTALMETGAPWYGKLRLDWVIAGGESGPKARPAHPAWFRSLRDQCEAAGVAFMLKQWGEWAPWAIAGQMPLRATKHVHLEDEDGGGGAETMTWLGKKAAGRMLDGVTHDGAPA